jgi:NADH:ubiquinone oxidoreductase subunit C
MDFVMIVIMHSNLKVVQYVKLISVDVLKLSRKNNEFILFYHFIEYEIYY